MGLSDKEKTPGETRRDHKPGIKKFPFDDVDFVTSAGGCLEPLSRAQLIAQLTQHLLSTVASYEARR